MEEEVLELTAPPLAPEPLPELPADGGPWPPQGQWTYEDYHRLPDDGRRYELIAGVLHVTPAPRFDHQYIVGELFAALRDYVRQHRLGVVIPAPFEVHLDPIARPVQPDLLFIRAEHRPAPETRSFEGPPDLVVEVLSPSTTRRDRVAKFWVYEQAGVPEYWIVDPRARLVEVYTLQDGRYSLHAQYLAGDEVASPLFSDLALLVADLFPAQR